MPEPTTIKTPDLDGLRAYAEANPGAGVLTKPTPNFIRFAPFREVLRDVDALLAAKDAERDTMRSQYATIETAMRDAMERAVRAETELARLRERPARRRTVKLPNGDEYRYRSRDGKYEWRTVDDPEWIDAMYLPSGYLDALLALRDAPTVDVRAALIDLLEEWTHNDETVADAVDRILTLTGADA